MQMLLMPEKRKKRKAVVFDRDPRERSNGDYVWNMQRLADADIALVVKGDEAELIKLRWDEPENYEVEVVRP
jgi:hypothetical protein